MNNNLKGSLLLSIATILWGSTFVAQEVAAKYIGSFTLNCLRSFVGCVVLIPLIFIFKSKREKSTGENKKILTKPLIIGGVLCGTALAVAANLQQFGIMFNAELSEGDSGKAGFITAMYIIFVPLISVFMGKKLRFSIVISVLISIFGLYFISVKQGFTVSTGDIVLLLCAVAFSGHILVIDRFVTKADAVALSSVQFLVAGVISGILMLIFERDCLTASNLTSSIIPVLYCGILSSGVAYTLQIIGQLYCETNIASLVMSLESVFSMLSACIFFGKLPTSREWIGCALMMTAILIVETPFADRVFEKVFKQKEKAKA